MLAELVLLSEDPRVKEVEFDEKGNIKKIIYHEPRVQVPGPRCPRSPNPCFCDGRCQGREPATHAYSHDGVHDVGR